MEPEVESGVRQDLLQDLLKEAVLEQRPERSEGMGLTRSEGRVSRWRKGRVWLS